MTVNDAGLPWAKLATAAVGFKSLSAARPEAVLTPLMQGVLTRMARAQAKPGFVPIHQLTPPHAREAYAKGADVLEVPKAELARAEDFAFTNRDGEKIPVRLYAPSHEKLPVLLYFHGGGLVIGSVQTHDILCRELSRLSGAAVISVDYRLAPEHPFPAALNDAWDALQWLAQADELGLNTGKIAVGGDSAGGGLAAVCALMARNAGLKLFLQLLIYPGVAAHSDRSETLEYAQGYVLEQEHVYYFSDSTIRRENAGHWHFSPINAPDHSDLTPSFIALAECDPLCAEGLAYADTLRIAGVTVNLKIYRGVTHEFIKMGRIIPEARQFHQDAALALKTAFEI
jgi:acetyl esterase